MYVPVWILLLIFLPATFGLIILLGMHTMVGISKLEGILSPFRHYGPWFDYVAAASVLAALVSLAALLA